ATTLAPTSPRQPVDNAAPRHLPDDLAERLARQRQVVASASSRQRAAQRTLDERLATLGQVQDSVCRDEHRLRQCETATQTATTALRSMEQEHHLPLLRTTPAEPAPAATIPGSRTDREPSRSRAAAAASAASPTLPQPAPLQAPRASAPPAATSGLH
ncbi:unnamed protein product, partial [Sphacelaria rigidula]